MDLFGNIRRFFNPDPVDPNITVVSTATQPIIDASAQIQNAWGARATTFQVNYNNQDLLITSAHLTTNGVGDARGFYSGGKQYFVVVRDGHIALAEHVLFNPQGGPCTRSTFHTGESFRDISILRLLSPEEATPVMHSIWANNEGGVGDPARGIPKSPRERMADIVRTTPELRYLYTEGNDGISGADMVRVLRDFELGSVELPPEPRRFREPRVTPAGYALGYHTNQPRTAYGNFSRVDNGEDDYYYKMSFDDEGVPVADHGWSGGPAFDVDQRGRIVWRGITTGVVDEGEGDDRRVLYQVTTPMQYVYEGLNIVTRHIPENVRRLIPEAFAAQAAEWVCPTDVTSNGHDAWVTPETDSELLPPPLQRHPAIPDAQLIPRGIR